MSSFPAGLKLEVCVDSVESALAAEAGGADRIELGADLLRTGGITPSLGLLAAVLEAVTLPVHVLIRPRGGDFCYTDTEFAIMKRDLETVRSLGAAGVVTGILRPDGGIDRTRMAELVSIARPLSVTFHRAFDLAADPLRALEDVIALGCDRLLTSGQERTASEGRDLLAKLVVQAAGRIVIMPGAGVSEENIAELARTVGAREYHSSAKVAVASPMTHRNERVAMSAPAVSEHTVIRTSAERVRALRTALDGAPQARN
ncbi:MAG: copper homeostasis protein CutC [Chloroflexota bacterium]